MDRDEQGRFQKGHPGGPGRPRKEDSVAEHLRRLGSEQLDNGRTRTEELALAMWNAALQDGDMTVAERIADRTGGKPTQRIEQTGEADLAMADFLYSLVNDDTEDEQAREDTEELAEESAETPDT